MSCVRVVVRQFVKRDSGVFLEYMAGFCIARQRVEGRFREVVDLMMIRGIVVGNIATLDFVWCYEGVDLLRT